MCYKICDMEIYASSTADGEGQWFIGEGEAGLAGNFDIVVSDFPYSYLTATATNIPDDDGTSEFSEVFTFCMIKLPFVVND